MLAIASVRVFSQNIRMKNAWFHQITSTNFSHHSKFHQTKKLQSGSNWRKEKPKKKAENDILNDSLFKFSNWSILLNGEYVFFINIKANQVFSSWKLSHFCILLKFVHSILFQKFFSPFFYFYFSINTWYSRGSAYLHYCVKNLYLPMRVSFEFFFENLFRHPLTFISMLYLWNKCLPINSKQRRSETIQIALERQ